MKVKVIIEVKRKPEKAGEKGNKRFSLNEQICHCFFLFGISKQNKKSSKKIPTLCQLILVRRGFLGCVIH